MVLRVARRRLSRDEIEEMVREDLDESIVMDIGEEGVEATEAGLMVLDAMITYNCDDEAFDAAFDAVEDVAEGRSDREIVNCNGRVHLVIQRGPDGKIRVDILGAEE